MATAAQQRANQENAQHSTGPRTAEGKQRSSQNALKHGLCALDPLIPGEDPRRIPAALLRDRTRSPTGQRHRVKSRRANRRHLLASQAALAHRGRRHHRVLRRHRRTTTQPGQPYRPTARQGASAPQPARRPQPSQPLRGPTLAPLPPRPQGVSRHPPATHPRAQSQRRLRPLGRQATAKTAGQHRRQIQKHRTNPIHRNPIRINSSDGRSGTRPRPKHPRHHQLSSNPPKTPRPHRQSGGRKVTPTSPPHREPSHPQRRDTQPAPKAPTEPGTQVTEKEKKGTASRFCSPLDTTFILKAERGRPPPGERENTEDGYPVDSGNPNILWFWDFLGFCNRVNNHLVSRGIHGHRLLDEPIEEFASAFGFAAVETKGELVQVVVQMFVAHGALMGAQQPALEQ